MELHSETSSPTTSCWKPNTMPSSSRILDQFSFDWLSGLESCESQENVLPSGQPQVEATASNWSTRQGCKRVADRIVTILPRPCCSVKRGISQRWVIMTGRNADRQGGSKAGLRRYSQHTIMITIRSEIPGYNKEHFMDSLNISVKLHPFLKNIKFQNPAGDQVILDDKSKLEAGYDIVNIWNFPEGLDLQVKIGKFSPFALHDHQLSLSEDMVEWAIGTTEPLQSICSKSCGLGFRKSPQEGKAACCFDCIPCTENEMANGTDMEQCVKCPDHQYANTERNKCLLKAASFLAFREPLGMALACMALGLSTLTAIVLGVFVKHHNTPIVKANNQALSYILLISLGFCFLCSFLFIGHPNTVTCILQQTTFGVAFTVAVSAVLAKTVTVVLAFKVTTPGRRMRWLLVSGAPNFIIPICTLIQVTFCGIWLGTSPPFIDTDTHSEQGHLIIVCNKGSLTAFYCVLGYLGSLALASFTMAFMARNLPDTFNEAKFLTFSMVVFCSVWLSFLPVYHSAKGKVMVAVEVFSILASSTGLLGCIFVPKCYIILLRPDRNCLPGFRDKRH
ncbi:vomeronasal type-2 receptor 116-like [Perognathus longimembris pacificus]|uniref:vomeronasal type-2 receptor 116-like n=1 Tax=Perognathus longimembris pacificus TaxID=214514 RepID=UPI00201870FB|nr:vomeronasal type-2 receptor 116-like [Perognathus longimembris pacificus]